MRKLMWFSIGAAAACTAAVYLLHGRNCAVMAALCIVFAVAFAIVSFSWKACKPVFTIFLGAAVLSCWMTAFDLLYLSPIRQADGQTVSLTVTLTEYSTPTKYGIAVEGYTELEEKTYRIRAYINDTQHLKPGDTVIGSFLLEDTTSDPDSKYQMGNGVYLLAYPKGEIYIRSATKLPWYGYPAFFASAIKDLVQHAFPVDTVGFAQALLLGDTTLIDYETDTAFKLSGIRHIIAVSGLHVSILFSLVYFISGRKKWLTLLLGLPTLLLFAAIAGFTPSITRACIMHGLMMTAMLFEREYDPPTALSFAVLAMLMGNPYCISSVSLQLSAGCVCGILLFSGPISSWLMDPKRLGRYKGIWGKLAGWISSSAGVSLGATVATTPLCALYFGTVSLVSPLTNLLTLWAVTFIFYGIMLSTALAAICLPLGKIVAWLVSWPMRYVLQAAKLLASVPLAAVYTASIYIVLFLLFCYLLLLLFWCMKPKRPGILLCCMVLCLCLALNASWLEPLQDDFRMTVLDVGQGQCILLQSGGKTFMVDCGGDSDTGTADTAAQMLLSMGISKLDGLILTHYDYDHAGAAAYLLTRIDTETLYLPNCADEDGYAAALLDHPNAYLVDSNTSIAYDQTRITLIASDFASNDNESGLCVLFQQENCDILITGDRNRYGELELLRQIALPELDVLIVGHHGSKYSTSIELLEATRPKTAIISVGENSYGHPTQEVLDRLQQFNCEIYRTDKNGTVIFRR